MEPISPYSAILPNRQQSPLDLYMQLQQQQQEQERYQQQIKMQQDRYVNSLYADYAKDLNHNSYSGTPLDTIFQVNANNLLKELAADLKNNKYMEASMKAANGAGQLGAYAKKAKAIYAGIEEAAKQYQKSPSINWTKLRDLARVKAFHRFDGKELSMIDPRELDEKNDYVSEILDTTPELVTQGAGSLKAQIENGKYQPYKSDKLVDIGGVMREQAWEGKWDPNFNVLLNRKGEVVTPESMSAVKVGVKGEKIKIGGQEFTVVPDEVLNYFYNDKGTRAELKAAARNFMHYYGLTEGQKEVEKYLLHRELSNSANSYINPVKDKVDNSQLQSMLLRKELRALGNNRSKEEKETFIDVIDRIRQGDMNYMGNEYTGADAPVTGLRDITRSFPNGGLYGIQVSNKNGLGLTRQEYQRVLYSPNTGQFYVKKAVGSPFEPITDVDAWKRDIAGLNGVRRSQVVTKTKTTQPPQQQSKPLTLAERMRQNAGKK